MTVRGVAPEPLGTVNSYVVGTESAVHESRGDCSKWIVIALFASALIEVGIDGQLELPQTVKANLLFRSIQPIRGSAENGSSGSADD